MDITDAESAYLEAKSEVEEWQAEFMAEWFKPRIDMMKLMLYQQMDDTMKAQLRQLAPEGMKNLEELVKKAGG
jgi:hypothetical protein